MGTTPKNKAIDAEYLLNQLKNLDKDILETKYVQEKDVKDTYTATDENPISGKGVAVAVNTLQQDINKKSNIGHKHTKSEITDFPTSMTPTAHNQASNTINAMTDYSKATSVSAITPTDTLNVAIGKLEKALDSKGTSSFSGSYNDLTDKPTIPSVGNGTITVNQNGTKVGEFSTNQSTNAAINLTNTTYDVATSSKLGLVKSGTDITVDSSGNVSVNDDSHNHIISNVDGLQSALDGKAASSHTHDDRYYTESEINTKLNSKLNTSLKGSANGLAELDSNGKVLSSQLPSFVDDIIEGYLSGGKFYKESAHTTEITGETGKIYIDLTTNKTYRWSGSAFVVVSETLALGETSSTAYRGDRGKIAYDHSQSTHARTDATKVEKSSTNGNIKINGTETTVYTHPGGTNPHGTTKSDVGLGNVDNTADASKNVNSSKKLQTYKQGSTTETYGDSYNIYAQWRDPSHVKMKCDNYTVETDYATSAGSANSVAWNNVTGKPSTYTPSSHTHTKSQITDFPSSLPANGGNSATVNGHTVNSDVPSGAKFTDTWRPLGTTANDACAGNDSRLSNARPASDVYAWAKASSKPSYSWSEITSKPSTFTPASHSHNYAGSSSAGGSANSAVKLDTATAGSATQPVYFSGGKPVACSYTLGKSVPSNAVFTDTNTWRGIQNNLTSDSTTDSLSAAQGKVLKGLVDGKAASDHTHNYAGSSSAGGSANSVKVSTPGPSYDMTFYIPPVTVCPDDYVDFFRCVSNGQMQKINTENIKVGFSNKDFDGNIISSTYFKYTTVKVSQSSTVDIWRSTSEPNSGKRLVLFTAVTYGNKYSHDIVWFYNGKLYTPNFSSNVGSNTTLNNFTYTNDRGNYYVKYNNIDTSQYGGVATVKCYDFMG